MATQEFIIEEINTEIWKDVVEWEGIYSVSNLGRVRRDLAAKNARVGRILKLGMANGYYKVGLHHNYKIKTVYVHQLVAAAFIGKCPAGMEVNHKDPKTGRTDNRASNLEYVTPKGNMQHAKENGLVATGDRHSSRTHPEKVPRGENHHYARLKDAEIPRVFELRKSGMSQRKIGLIVGISQQYVCKILLGQKRKQAA
jgi:hypothetical protein